MVTLYLGTAVVWWAHVSGGTQQGMLMRLT